MKKEIIVTTSDLRQDYVVIGPVYFQVSNKGVFSSTLSKLVNKYSLEIENMKSQGQINTNKHDWGFLYGEWSVGQSDFEKAFFVAIQELKNRAKIVGADAIICMRQDIDLDTTAFQHFYLQMYGTAVKFIKSDHENNQEPEEEIQDPMDPNFEICPRCNNKSEKRLNICEYCSSMKH